MSSGLVINRRVSRVGPSRIKVRIGSRVYKFSLFSNLAFARLAKQVYNWIFPCIQRFSFGLIHYRWRPCQKQYTYENAGFFSLLDTWSFYWCFIHCVFMALHQYMGQCESSVVFVYFLRVQYCLLDFALPCSKFIRNHRTLFIGGRRELFVNVLTFTSTFLFF